MGRDKKSTANLFAVPAQFEIFGNRDLFNCSVKKMQLSEADRLSFAFLTEIKQISRKSHLLCDFFASFFSKKNEGKDNIELKLYKHIHCVMQLRNEIKINQEHLRFSPF